MIGFQKDDLKQKLIQGKTVYGTCITTNAPRWQNLVADSGLDFVFLDTEHIAIDRADLSRMCLGYQAKGLTPIVRIRRPDPYRASQAIDDGAIGVIAPYLENPAQIKELIGATKYRPLKGEKLESILSGKTGPSPELREYLDRFNHGNLCIANIESIPAVERLDELLSIEGLDAVFIGPHDLSINMGIPEQYDHPDFIAMVKTIVQKARKHTLGVGIHFSLEPQRQIDWIKEGVNIVIHSSDMALFSQRLREDISKIKSTSGEGNDSSGTGESVTI
ncbi:HpcH/HpaI aldolase/citrate lyase family protein [Algoriphagus sp. A40]|uniref:HpcH/HpaI aldolase family protein n=1 Tax=Algoriphagus sp. A40 TaxID=1945863 RepID=UPI00098772CD|nr:aldolase/citrate lyase family protein [Algoriphagus sp. A40]OOG72783.1 aldolase [Algoriphagus sp. A40]